MENEYQGIKEGNNAKHDQVSKENISFLEELILWGESMKDKR